MSYAQYEDALDVEGKPWIPKDTAKNGHPVKLIGTLVDLDERTTKFGAYPVLSIMDEAGETWTWHAFGTVAIKEVEKAAPELLDVIGVKYRGVSDTAKDGQSPAVLWTVKIFERRSAQQAPQPVAQGPAETAGAEQAGSGGDGHLPSPPPVDIEPSF